MTNSTPVLWQFAISHYAEKARWALDFKHVPHIRRSLLPGPHIGRVRKMTGQTATPVLELGGAIIFDSSRILEALEKAYPEPALYPPDPAGRARALDLENFFDEQLGPYLRQWAYFILLPHSATIVSLFAGRAGIMKRAMFRAMFPAVRPLMKRAMRVYPAEAEAARKKTIAAMERMASEVQSSGYLVGDRFTVADLTAAALLAPLVMPRQMPYYPPPEQMPQEFMAAREQLAAHPACAWVRGIYERHRGTSAAVAEETVL